MSFNEMVVLFSDQLFFFSRFIFKIFIFKICKFCWCFVFYLNDSSYYSSLHLSIILSPFQLLNLKKIKTFIFYFYEENRWFGTSYHEYMFWNQVCYYTGMGLAQTNLMTKRWEYGTNLLLSDTVCLTLELLLSPPHERGKGH